MCTCSVEWCGLPGFKSYADRKRDFFRQQLCCCGDTFMMWRPNMSRFISGCAVRKSATWKSCCEFLQSQIAWQGSALVIGMSAHLHKNTAAPVIVVVMNHCKIQSKSLSWILLFACRRTTDLGSSE